jgi:hypothetical protein
MTLSSNSPVTHDKIISDPAKWPKIYVSKITDHLILYGPKKVQLMNYPQNENGGHFSDGHYFHKLANS